MLSFVMLLPGGTSRCLRIIRSEGKVHIYLKQQGKEHTMNTGNTANTYKELFTELEKYEENGICMLMDGSKVSPMQVVAAHMIREGGSYMRDYILDPEGYIKSLIFVNIKEENKENANEDNKAE